MLPALLQPGLLEPFPDPNAADDEGLVAVGGDLSVERLLLAYDHGIFPWFSEDNPELWWSPDPRAVLAPRDVHISRSMSRWLRSHEFTVTWNRAFPEVMRACAEDRCDGTWILPEMIVAYTELHRQRHAHCVDVWRGTDLVGGIYGVHRGGLFAAESMFHRADNASKLALITLAQVLSAQGIELIDVQFLTPHLASMGAIEIPRTHYLDIVQNLHKKTVRLPDQIRIRGA
jgi:leucyl/phenylalanyl-tRNA---protein transferase